MTGTIEAIHVAPAGGESVRAVERVRAVAGRGLEGDRYFADEGTYDRGDGHVTLIEREALAAVERDHDISLDPGAHRRNVTTSGVALNHLVGERFRVGGALCEGLELCEPCKYLEDLLGEDGLRRALVHRGGLRARVVESGTLATGDDVGPA